MANDGQLENRTFMHVPGDKLTWRHMELNNGNSKFARTNNNRYFAIKLDDDFAQELQDEGWPVVWNNIAKEGEPEQLRPYFKIFIKYGTPYPVDIYLVNAKQHTKTLLQEKDLDDLTIDHQTIESIDVVVRSYYWTYMNDHGVKAQVVAMNILLAQNGLDDDYEIVYK